MKTRKSLKKNGRESGYLINIDNMGNTKRRKSVAIVGAGFTGLSVAYELNKNGLDVSVFESLSYPGGLAIGFKQRGWSWCLEKHYHHLFVSDYAIISLAKKISHNIIFKKILTSTFIMGQIYPMDSAFNLLMFRPLSFISRLRVGIVLLFLKINPYWQMMETITAKNFLILSMGEGAWRILWNSLFLKKFGKFYDRVNAAWFWSRIKKRSVVLGYPEGGFQSLAKALEKVIRGNSGEFFYNTKIKNITKKGGKFIILTDKNQNQFFDYVVCTLPLQSLVNMFPRFPKYYIKNIHQMQGLGAINLVISSKHELLKNGTYWLNINQEDFPFLCVVEQTNFIDSDKYNNEHIIYVGVYKDKDHIYFKKSAQSLFKEYKPFLQQINKKFNISWINSVKVFKASFAQPVIPVNYSRIIPPLKTPVKGLYLANMQQVYPWDRGTNYAVELGQKVSRILLHDIKV